MRRSLFQPLNYRERSRGPRVRRHGVKANDRKCSLFAGSLNYAPRLLKQGEFHFPSAGNPALRQDSTAETKAADRLIGDEEVIG